MKVLFVCKSIDRKNENPYVGVLVHALQKHGIEVDWGLDNFWHNYEQYDVIHFQWPEKIFGGGKKIDFERINSHIDLLKSKGIKLVITCHNLTPHKSKPELAKLYDLLYNRCDAIHHMGEYSFNYLKERTGNSVSHFIIEHHVYYDLGEFNVDREFVRKKLGIKDDAKVVLCFGAFRFKKEQQMVLNAFNQLELTNKLLLAPSFFKNKGILGFIYHKLRQYFSPKYRNLCFRRGFVSNEYLPYYLIASDVLLIQRTSILNSGNLPLGFSFGKVVVGPDRGNVGCILRRTDNPVFDPENAESVIAALQSGFNSLQTKSLENLNYAKSYLDKDNVAMKMIAEYNKILNR